MENQNQETQKQQRKELTLRQKRNMMYFVEATEKILKEEGIPGVTIRRIAAEAGYNSATLYNYFQDLDELILFGSVCFLRDYLLSLARHLEPEMTALERTGPSTVASMKEPSGSRKSSTTCSLDGTAPNWAM